MENNKKKEIPVNMSGVSTFFKNLNCLKDSDWVLDQPDEKRQIRILALLESVRLCTMRKPASIISLNGNTRSSETSAKLSNNINVSDSNDRYGGNHIYQQRNEDNISNLATRRKYRQQQEQAYQEHVVSKLPEKSFTRRILRETGRTKSSLGSLETYTEEKSASSDSDCSLSALQRTPLSSSTSHSGDRLCQSGNLKETNDNLSLPSYRRKYITNKKPGIKPASHFTERCKNSAPACRTRSLHYLAPKHGVSFGDLQFTSSQTIVQKHQPVNVSKTLPRSLRYRSFNNDLRSAPTKLSKTIPCSKDILDIENISKSCSDNSADFLNGAQSTDLVPDFNVGVSSIQLHIQEACLENKEFQKNNNKTANKNKHELSTLGKLSTPNLEKENEQKYVKHAFYQHNRPESNVINKRSYGRVSISTNEFQRLKTNEHLSPKHRGPISRSYSSPFEHSKNSKAAFPSNRTTQKSNRNIIIHNGTKPTEESMRSIKKHIGESKGHTKINGFSNAVTNGSNVNSIEATEECNATYTISSSNTQSMRDKRLAFLLGEDQMKNEDGNNIHNHGTSRGLKAPCTPVSGVSKKIQNKIKSNSNETSHSVSTNNSPSKEVLLKRGSTSSSYSMYDSAEIVANALGKSRSYNNESHSIKSSSVSNLRKNSPKAKTCLNDNTGSKRLGVTNEARSTYYKFDMDKKYRTEECNTKQEDITTETNAVRPLSLLETRSSASIISPMRKGLLNNATTNGYMFRTLSSSSHFLPSYSAKVRSVIDSAESKALFSSHEKLLNWKIDKSKDSEAHSVNEGINKINNLQSGLLKIMSSSIVSSNSGEQQGHLSHEEDCTDEAKPQSVSDSVYKKERPGKLEIANNNNMSETREKKLSSSDNDSNEESQCDDLMKHNTPMRDEHLLRSSTSPVNIDDMLDWDIEDNEEDQFLSFNSIDLQRKDLIIIDKNQHHDGKMISEVENEQKINANHLNNSSPLIDLKTTIIGKAKIANTNGNLKLLGENKDFKITEATREQLLQTVRCIEATTGIGNKEHKTDLKGLKKNVWNGTESHKNDDEKNFKDLESDRVTSILKGAIIESSNSLIQSFLHHNNESPYHKASTSSSIADVGSSTKVFDNWSRRTSASVSSTFSGRENRSAVEIDLLDLYCDDELHPSLENDPNMQLFIAHTPSPHDGDNANDDLSPPFLTDRDSVLSMEIPSTGPQSLRSEFGEEREYIGYNSGTGVMEGTEN